MVREYPDGNFVGPSVVEVTTDMSAYKYVGHTLVLIAATRYSAPSCAF